MSDLNAQFIKKTMHMNQPGDTCKCRKMLLLSNLATFDITEMVRRLRQTTVLKNSRDQQVNLFRDQVKSPDLLESLYWKYIIITRE